MRGCNGDVDSVQLPPATTINYSDDEILRESAPLVDDVVCVDSTSVATAPRRKSADYGYRRTCFEPYSRLDVEHRPLSIPRHDDDDERQVDRRLATQQSYDDQPSGASSHVDSGHFSRSTTHDSATADSISTITAWPCDSEHRDDDGVAWWRGGAAAVNCRRRFIDKQLADYERRASSSASSATATASHLSTPYVRSVSDQGEFVVRRRDADLSSTASSSSSSPASRLIGRLAPQLSPPVADVIPTTQRLPPTSLRARKREQAARSRSAAVGGLRRSNSVSGSSARRSLHSGDEGFADGRTRTPEPLRISGSQRHLGEACCLCHKANSRGVEGSQSNVSTTSDRARKRSYRVGLNLFNKYVISCLYSEGLISPSYIVQCAVSHISSVSLYVSHICLKATPTHRTERVNQRVTLVTTQSRKYHQPGECS